MRQFIIIIGLAAGLIAFGIWFSGNSRIRPIAVADVPVTIVLKNGVYQPGLIRVPAGKIIKLHFLRVDNGGCAASVLFPQLNVAYQLPLNQITEVDLPPQPSGEVEFTCQMGSYHGKLIVA